MQIGIWQLVIFLGTACSGTSGMNQNGPRLCTVPLEPWLEVVRYGASLIERHNDFCTHIWNVFEEAGLKLKTNKTVDADIKELIPIALGTINGIFTDMSEVLKKGTLHDHVVVGKMNDRALMFFDQFNAIARLYAALKVIVTEGEDEFINFLKRAANDVKNPSPGNKRSAAVRWKILGKLKALETHRFYERARMDIEKLFRTVFPKLEGSFRVEVDAITVIKESHCNWSAGLDIEQDLNMLGLCFFIAGQGMEGAQSFVYSKEKLHTAFDTLRTYLGPEVLNKHRLANSRQDLGTDTGLPLQSDSDLSSSSFDLPIYLPPTPVKAEDLLFELILSPKELESKLMNLYQIYPTLATSEVFLRLCKVFLVTVADRMMDLIDKAPADLIRRVKHEGVLERREYAALFAKYEKEITPEMRAEYEFCIQGVSKMTSSLGKTLIYLFSRLVATRNNMVEVLFKASLLMFFDDILVNVMSSQSEDDDE